MRIAIGGIKLDAEQLGSLRTLRSQVVLAFKHCAASGRLLKNSRLRTGASGSYFCIIAATQQCWYSGARALAR